MRARARAWFPQRVVYYSSSKIPQLFIGFFLLFYHRYAPTVRRSGIFHGRSMVAISSAIPVIGSAFDSALARSLADVSRIIGEKVDARCPAVLTDVS